MTMDELMTEQRIERVRSVDPAAMAFQREAEAARSGGLRRAVATGLVRVGMVLDRAAVERARPASQPSRVNNGGDDGLAWHLR